MVKLDDKRYAVMNNILPPLHQHANYKRHSLCQSKFLDVSFMSFHFFSSGTNTQHSSNGVGGWHVLVLTAPRRSLQL